NTSQAIRWAAQHGAQVINLSLGTNETFGVPTDMQLAIDYAWSRGALIVAAAGNAGTGTLDYPARLPNVVSFAAIDETGPKAFISVNAYPTSVSRSSTFGVTWSILGPVGTPVADTHVVWGTASGRLGNATPTQSGSTHQSYTANGLTLPSGADTFYFKVVATV